MSVTLILSVRIALTRLCTPSVAGGCSSRPESSVEALLARSLSSTAFLLTSSMASLSVNVGFMGDIFSQSPSFSNVVLAEVVA
jgi:hypothetical protein